MEICLSICIPTWNRATYLKENIQAIINQIANIHSENDVEIVISDNASTDETREVVSGIVKQNPVIRIIYHRNRTNIGPDANYIEVVKHAKGRYCWLLGSDDIIPGGSIGEILRQIESNNTVYIFNRTNCDINMIKKHEQSFFYPSDKLEEIYSLSDTNDWCYYLNNCISLGGVFSYISGMVFQKDMWDSITDYDNFIGTAYVHVAIIIKTLIQNPGCTIKHINSSLILNRMGNDSFFKTVYQRTMLDLNGYNKLSELFQDEDSRRSFRQILHREHPFPNWRLIVKTTNREFDLLMKALEGIYSNSELILYKQYRDNRILYFILVVFIKIKEKLRRRIS